MKTAEQILQLYHRVSHDASLKTDLWPSLTVLEAMKEYARHVAEDVKQDCKDECVDSDSHNYIDRVDINQFIK